MVIPMSEEKGEETVLIIGSGEKYHRIRKNLTVCGWNIGYGTKIKRSEAERLGKDACKVCF